MPNTFVLCYTIYYALEKGTCAQSDLQQSASKCTKPQPQFSILYMNYTSIYSANVQYVKTHVRSTVFPDEDKYRLSICDAIVAHIRARCAHLITKPPKLQYRAIRQPDNARCTPKTMER